MGTVGSEGMPGTEALLSWYRQHGRQLPWREDPSPYRVWVSEAMLQQTRVESVLPYYHRFLTRFPSLRALAEAPLDEVLALWEGLGYYARARHLHAAAREVLARFGGEIPRDAGDLRSLPGVGPYMAGAILSFGYGVAEPAIDTNVGRVLARRFLIEEPLGMPRVGRELDRLARSLLPPAAAFSFNQAIMELGALVCLPRQPRCASCPWQEGCRAHQTGAVDRIPVRAVRRPVPRIPVLVLIPFQPSGLIWLSPRPQEGLLGGLWQPPTLEGASGSEAAGAWLQEQGLTPRTWFVLPSFSHTYSHRRWEVSGFAVEVEGSPILGEGRWVNRQELGRLPLGRVHRRLVDETFLLLEKKEGRHQAARGRLRFLE